MKIVLCVLMLSLCSCATKLTSAGQTVQVLYDVPTNCIALGEIFASDRMSGKYINSKNKLMNQAAEMGANILVIDRVERISHAKTIAHAYKCPDKQIN